MPATIPAKEVVNENCPLCISAGGKLTHLTYCINGPVLKCDTCHCRFFPRKKFFGLIHFYEMGIHFSDLRS